MPYDFHTIEKKWQSRWAQHSTFSALNPGDAAFDPELPKYYVLDMFPYPSGVGLHVGHPLGYIATDIVARYKRMRGFNVLHPMGYDAFGLPAEQFAVEHNVHPRVTTEQNIANMTSQLKRLGLSYDWDRKIATTDTDYYRWTQWIFLQLYHSYFDPISQSAKPIRELQAKLESGEYDVSLDGELVTAAGRGSIDMLGGLPGGAKKWTELETDQQRRLLDEYRLAFLSEVDVNWCPALGTVLANEEVTNDGRSERGNHPVFKRPLKQWMLRITAYNERLIDDLDQVDWPESVKLLQRNWVGKSTGAYVNFAVADGGGEGETISVFTTRPDTLFGATYMVLAPEHELVDVITTDAQRADVDAYRAQTANKTDLDRQADQKEKTGVFTGAHAINPVNGQAIPIWIADYVMMGYGTGAIMAVPAHDDRDHAFAKKFGLPIVEVVAGGDDVQAEAYTGDGQLVNAANDEVSLNGLSVGDAKARIVTWLENVGGGRAAVQYKLRDWLFSRQRYWGEPFPILHELDENGERTGVIRAVDENALPVEHPHMDDFKPSASDDPDQAPRPPLGRADDAWRLVEIDGVRYERELNTMPQWAGSCWYYLRFCDSKNGDAFVGNNAEKYWMNGGVDLYVGGVEHAVLHLLYARFWHKVLFDLGHVSTAEPFGKLFNQGYIQAYAYTDERGVYVPAEEVEGRDGGYFYEGKPVSREFGKMGKSLKNSIAPDAMCDEYGCDTLRLYEMYLGPLDQSKVWNTRDIVGVHRFLHRVWRNLIDDETNELLVDHHTASDELRRQLHRTIAKVTDDCERMSFNTAIAALIELNNALVPLAKVPLEVAEAMVLLLSPFAPHLCEELWERLRPDEPKGLARAPWPGFDEALLVADTIEYPVQIKGKLKSRITVAADADQKTVEALELADEKVAAAIEGKTVRKVIVVPGKMVNIVV